MATIVIIINISNSNVNRSHDIFISELYKIKKLQTHNSIEEIEYMLL